MILGSLLDFNSLRVIDVPGRLQPCHDASSVSSVPVDIREGGKRRKTSVIGKSVTRGKMAEDESSPHPVQYHASNAPSGTEPGDQRNRIDQSHEKLDGAVLEAAADRAAKRAWDVSSLLSEKQREAVASLGELLQHRPLARPEWNVSMLDDDVEGGEHADAAASEDLSIAELYRQLGEAQAAAQDQDTDDLAAVRDHHARMTGIVQLCDKIISLLGIVEETLVRLQTQHDSVVDKTSALHAECETLLADKVHLEALAATIESRLKVYDQLEGMQRQLTAPGFSVSSPAFMPLLVQVDEAIAQLSKSGHFADTPAFLHRFRNVQGRAHPFA